MLVTVKYWHTYKIHNTYILLEDGCQLAYVWGHPELHTYCRYKCISKDVKRSSINGTTMKA